MEKNTTTNVFFLNAGSLIVLQIANYIFPFIVVPFLIRKLGASLYGVVAFSFALIHIGNIIVDYGFKLSATYAIAKAGLDKEKIIKINSAVFVCKSVLLLLCLLVFGLYIEIQTKYIDYRFFMWVMLLSVVANAYTPLWLFQGIEKMAYMTFFNVISKSLYCFQVVIFIKSFEDFNFISLYYSIGQLMAMAISIFIMYRMKFPIIWPGKAFTLAIFRTSTSFFWSRASVAIYTSFGAFFLGLFSTSSQVAYFSAAQQLYNGVQAIFNSFSQALFPHMAKHKNFQMFFRVLIFVTFFATIGCIIVYFQLPWFITFFYGESFLEIIPLIEIFLLIFCITTPSIILGYPFLGALGKINLANRSVIYAGLLQIILLFILYITNKTSAVNVVVSVLVIELFVLSLRVFWGMKYFKK